MEEKKKSQKELHYENWVFLHKCILKKLQMFLGRIQIKESERSSKAKR